MKREFWSRHIPRRDLPRFWQLGDRGDDDDLLGSETRLAGRRDAEPAVLDAQPRRVTMLDVLARARDRRDEYDRNRDDEDAEARRNSGGQD